MASEDDWIRVYVDRRFEDQEKAVQAALVASEKGIAAALASSEKAVDKAEVGAQRWRDSANEWRGAMIDRERAFMTRKEFYAIIGAIAAVLVIIRAFGPLAS